MDFDNFIARAWDDHQNDSQAVARRLLPEGLPLADSAQRCGALARLAHHMHGEHRGDWAGGITALQQVAAQPAVQADAEVAATVQRYVLSLQLAAAMVGREARLAALHDGNITVADHIRIQAMTAATLAPHHVACAGALLQQAAAEHEAAALPADDPATRALAVAGNNIAATLCEAPHLSDAQRHLMIEAAQLASRFWQRAGGWLEDERAEHRLAEVWLKAGDAAQAQVHARRCLDIVAASGDAPLERFFGQVVLGRAAAALGHGAAHGHALAAAQAAFDALPADDRGWCEPSLAELRAT
ncbi:MAG: hypothetical protein LH480_00850 [Rubrivivax sp.]|nr:hypothetical protein [Rubrivivax sp.]